jgi:acyl CoA:acetate/3-ketoacid CoA transferase
MTDLSKVTSFEAAARLIPDGAVVTVSSSSGLGCPDRMPIAAGDMYGIKGVDHLAKEGLIAKIVAGSYPSGPSSLPMPEIWRLITENKIPAYNVPSGILYDMHREAASHRPGVLTTVGLDTYVDPDRQGSAMNPPWGSTPTWTRIARAAP